MRPTPALPGRRGRAAATLVVASVLLATACGDRVSSSADDGPPAGRFDRVQLREGEVVATTGRFVVGVTTDPLHLEARIDGDPVVAEAPGGGLYVVRGGEVVDATSASVRSVDDEGLVFDLALADGSGGVLEVLPVSHGTVRVVLEPDDRAATTHWGERFATPVGERIYGLTEQVSTDPDDLGGLGTLDLRGARVEVAAGSRPPSAPFHQTSHGYGVLVDGQPSTTYDLAASTPEVLELRAEVPVEPTVPLAYHLFVGPRHEQILEEHHPFLPMVQSLGPAVAPAPTTEAQLRAEMVATQRAAFLGRAYRPPGLLQDEQPADEEVVVRAGQLAAVAPSVGPLPGYVDERSAALHELLQPYVEELLADAEQTGLTAVRPLAFRYADQEGTGDRWDQWMLGDDLLVAPVWETGDRNRTVWFPPGRWVDLWDRGEVVEGPIQLEVDAPLAQMPLFVAEGSDLLERRLPR